MLDRRSVEIHRHYGIEDGVIEVVREGSRQASCDDGVWVIFKREELEKALLCRGEQRRN